MAKYSGWLVWLEFAMQILAWLAKIFEDDNDSGNSKAVQKEKRS